MKKNILKKQYNTIIILFLLCYFSTTAQVVRPFKPRFDNKLRGDMTIIANTIVNRIKQGKKTPNDPYNAPYTKEEINKKEWFMRYIDIDNDSGTFNSSSARLTLPDKRRSKIIYAGLYWSADYKYDILSISKKDVLEAFEKIKLKVPGGVYVDIRGKLIHNLFDPIGFSPYACYADITPYVTALKDPSGDYFVANISVDQKDRSAGGWTIFFVYENPDLSSRYITSFDGFAVVNYSLRKTDIPFTGFNTVSKGTVKAKLASAVLRGDKELKGDQLQFKAENGSGFIDLSSNLRPKDNFFNGRISILGEEYLDRIPASRNTLGYDTDITDISGLMKPGDTSATLRLITKGDVYYMFFGAFNVEIMKPYIKVVKKVENPTRGSLVAGKLVPDQQFYYVFSFVNKGNDDAIATTIKNKLPADIEYEGLVLFNGVNGSYDKQNHTVNFIVSNELVKKGGGIHKIKIKVRVADCNAFREVNSEKIESQAEIGYQGKESKADITDEKSFSDDNESTPSPTKVDIDIQNCEFENDVGFCKDSVLLSAPGGYNTYIWKDSQGNRIGTDSTYTATVSGIYTVDFQGSSGSLTKTAKFIVKPSIKVNLDQSKDIAGCEAGDKNAEITATAIGGIGGYRYELFEKIQGSIAGPQRSGTFRNLGAGRYYIKVTDRGNCEGQSEEFTINTPIPLIVQMKTVQGVSCKGKEDGLIAVSVTGGSSRYLYVLDPLGSVKYVQENVFKGLKSGDHTIMVQDQVTGCSRSLNVRISEPDKLEVKVDTVTHELCKGDGKGSIKVSVEGGTAPYSTSIKANGPFIRDQFEFRDLKGGKGYTIYVKDAHHCRTEVLVRLDASVDLQPRLQLKAECSNNVPTNTVTVAIDPGIDPRAVTYSLDRGVYQLSNTFRGVGAGQHIIFVKHANGCIKEQRFRTNNVPITGTLRATSIVCGGKSTGSISITASGGTGKLKYAISTDPTKFQDIPLFKNLATGLYTVYVKDKIGCILELSTEVTEIPASEVDIKKMNIEHCYGDKTGLIEIEISKGTPPYSTSLNSTALSAFVPNRVLFEKLISGVDYTIYVKDANGCITAHKVDMPVAVDTNPVVDVRYVCLENQSTGVEVKVNPRHEREVTYSLDGGAEQSLNTYTDLSPGIHTIKVEHTNGCKSTAQFEVIAVSALDLTFPRSGLNEIVAKAKGGSGQYRYYFNEKDHGSSNIYKVKKTGIYSVTVLDNVGCEVTKDIYMEFFDIEISNYFTPNIDGHNDTWAPKKLEPYPEVKTYIHDRQGREVRVLRLGEAWDGKYQGKPLPSGDYWYLLKLNGKDDHRTFVGNVTLYR